MEIVQIGNKILREKAKEVTKEMFGSSALKKVLKNMEKALNAQKDGVAIAAPQIGESLRIFIVAGKVFDMQKGNYDENKSSKTSHQIFINPKITKLSKEKKEMEEGCLSVRWLYGKVKRHSKTEIEALDENGKKFKRGASGLLSQIFQHETDHLDGVLFIDKALDVVSLPPVNS